MREIVGIGFGYELALIWFLHEILIALLVGKVNSIFLALELYAMAIHKVGGRLPTHEWILPSVALGKDIPVHQPVRSVPVARLRCRLSGTIYAALNQRGST